MTARRSRPRPRAKLWCGKRRTRLRCGRAPGCCRLRSALAAAKAARPGPLLAGLGTAIRLSRPTSGLTSPSPSTTPTSNRSTTSAASRLSRAAPATPVRTAATHSRSMSTLSRSVPACTSATLTTKWNTTTMSDTPSSWATSTKRCSSTRRSMPNRSTTSTASPTVARKPARPSPGSLAQRTRRGCRAHWLDIGPSTATAPTSAGTE